MSVNAGTRFGPYEILSAIGAGGMGEVYKARDTRLDRTVAIKVLPTHLAGRSELRERFEREAKTIASLNHPHICTLYDTGHQNEIDFLVMEYLEGETLAQRLQKGSLPIQQVLQFAIEIADALDKAHRKGITHRDLKPGNIMLTKSGTKLLDFGLAKLTQDAVPATPESQLPTMKSAITGEGTVLGTLQYMAPEQVEAKEVDARTDIFAFGAVVYEMATGKKAFEGKSSASVMAKILEAEPPPISSLQPMMPQALDRVVKRCLAKEPDERWQSANDLANDLRWIAEQESQAAAPVAGVARRKTREQLAWTLAAVALILAALATAFPFFHRTVAVIRPVRFTINPPEKERLPVLAFTPNFLSVSPSGSRLVFVAMDSTGHPTLWIRDLDSLIAQPLPGTDNAFAPFWSPDSRFIAFTADSALKKVAVEGGLSQTLTAVGDDGMGTWNREGVILFTAPGPHPILRVSSAGGTATPATALDASRQQDFHAWPYFLPDGRHFLYLGHSRNQENSAIYVGSLDSKETKFVLNAGSAALFSPPGYLLFVRAGTFGAGTLMAQPFDADRLELKGDALPIAGGVQFNSTDGEADVAVSENGVLAYRLAPTNGQINLVWVDRKGGEQPLPVPPHAYRNPRLSPDGQRLAITIDELGSQEWLLDIARGTLTRLTFEGGYNGAMAWTPDGKRITFGTDRAGPRNLFWQLADGSGRAEQLATSNLGDVASSWSPDGQTLAYQESSPGAGFDLWVLRMSDHKALPFLQTRFNEISPRFSPDGHWLAYASDESGRYEIYVQPYPGPGGKWQISTDGGTEPVWARNGELFYRNGDKMMAVETNTKSTFSADKPKLLFERHYATYNTMPAYDVTPDGQRFLLAKAAGQGPQEINVVLNWNEELKQKVASGNK
jgi:Tol biopolymer transport system component/predicted Ser/Thr protein kinase